ncbi:hypothetical protein HMPREF1574_01139 [Gardnerella pickettii JCP7659]|uniref:Uncharacterized protein n=1 Tax=Gardnerella pickettii JCP8017A TaxID=1261062 RepID=T2PLF5_9BIFI|nr:hypothetical protein HMPREF1577_00497 [Gardnerella pickettii JCP8017A]EPI54508.1 hypothetical protein HMPREF1574_01139 [Gardnerella pickettii JCP7659]
MRLLIMRDYCLIVVTILRSYTSFIGKSQENHKKNRIISNKKIATRCFIKNSDNFL